MLLALLTFLRKVRYSLKREGIRTNKHDEDRVHTWASIKTVPGISTWTKEKKVSRTKNYPQVLRSYHF